MLMLLRKYFFPAHIYLINSSLSWLSVCSGKKNLQSEYRTPEQRISFQPLHCSNTCRAHADLPVKRKKKMTVYKSSDRTKKSIKICEFNTQKNSKIISEFFLHSSRFGECVATWLYFENSIFSKYPVRTKVWVNSII